MAADESVAFREKWKAHELCACKRVLSKIGARIFDFRCEPAHAGVFVTVIEDVTEQRRPRTKSNTSPISTC